MCRGGRRIEDHLDVLTGKLDKLDHHLEHALASVQDHIANMVGKLEQREDKSEGRIGNLEEVSGGAWMAA